MESTAKHFAFDSLPMELKEKVLEKVNPVDSMKLLKVNKQLRAYILNRGPLYKRFEKIEYDFTIDLLLITYHFGDERLEMEHSIRCYEDLNFFGYMISIRSFSGCGNDYFYHLSSPERSHFRFLQRTQPPKRIKIGIDPEAYFFDDCMPVACLEGIVPKCRFLHGISFHWVRFEDFKVLMRIFSSECMRRIEFTYTDSHVDISERAECLSRFKAMLVDCKEMVINLENSGKLLFDALRESQVEKISVNNPFTQMNWFMEDFEELATKGIPSRNSRATISYRILHFFPELPLPVFKAEFDPEAHRFDIPEFCQRIRLDVPSVRQLEAEEGRKYEELFQGFMASNNLSKHPQDLLWIYETNTPKKCIFFVYLPFLVKYVYLFAHYA